MLDASTRRVMRRFCSTFCLKQRSMIHLLDGDQRPGLPQMSWLPPALASTRPPAYALPPRLWEITGRRARGVVRVLLEALQQWLDGGFQRGDTCFEGADILSDGNRCVLPQLWWEGCMEFMGLDYTRLDTGWQDSRTATT